MGEKKILHDEYSSKLKTIGEVAKDLDVEQYVLRFWEEKFPQVNPIKRRGRRLYSQVDVDTLKHIKHLLYDKGYKIKGVQQELGRKPANINKHTNDTEQSVYRKDLISLLDDMLSLRDSLLKKFNGM
ncbi:transcriptional regulator, MerR family [Ehrlichia chaffeensis str. Arkansas]|uniref:Transcriptional regulator, MerR family n=1 Tax=Ehrlichia chaffeensis (strain ATCC CRL-10679 / Arkansas) TaxID=205920 RepID=Q2GHU3_EHRCR|nr:MerR family transcriptional regulator [Ehrlichia chaffeensis]ABD45154.1 transcriptional regulator, MerR family [Ehrlichia chaffeensis str. Arkansas]